MTQVFFSRTPLLSQHTGYIISPFRGRAKMPALRRTDWYTDNRLVHVYTDHQQIYDFDEGRLNKKWIMN